MTQASKVNTTPKLPTSEGAAVAELARRFGEAVAEIDRFELEHEDDDSDEANERRHKLEGEISDLLGMIRNLPAADLATLRLKARAVLYCNPALSHVDGEPLDEQLTRSIVLRLATHLSA